MKTILSILLASVLPLIAADTTISGLPAIGNVTGNTIVPVVDVAGTPTTKKATVTQLLAGLPNATTSVPGLLSPSDKTKLDSSTATANVSSLMSRDSSGNTAVNSLTAVTVTGLAAPTNPTDAANKSYVDAAAVGLHIIAPALAATTANVTLSGGAPNVVDGVTLLANSRVLVKDQTDPKQNGVYYVSTLGTGSNGTWLRTADTDTGAELVTGTYVFVTDGTVNANAAYVMVTQGTIVIGTSNIAWALFSQVNSIAASSITGQIVAAQIQDLSINTAKFASSITPVEIFSSLPTSGNFAGRTVYNTSDGQLYRYSGSAFTKAIPATDITGQITTTQIEDGAIKTPKLFAGSVTGNIIAANTITSNNLDVNAVTAGKIAAGAVRADQIAVGAIDNPIKIADGVITANQIGANAVTTLKIKAGSITADRMNITGGLSSITANIGVITSGTITANTSMLVGSGLGAVSISSSGLTIGSGRISLAGDGANPWMRVYGVGPYSGAQIDINGSNSASPPRIQITDGSGIGFSATPNGAYVGNSRTLTIDSGSIMQGPGSILLNSDNGSSVQILGGEDGSAGSLIGYWKFKLNGRTVKVPIYND